MPKNFSTEPLLSELPVLRAIVEGTAQATGEDFFQLLVENLSVATGAANAFIAQFADEKTRVRTLAFWMEGQIIDNQEWELAGTPCEDVIKGKFCHYPSDVWKLFPKSQGVESFLGVPLKDVDGNVLGHLAIFDYKAMPEQPQLLYTFKIFAARATAELRRIQAVNQLRFSEERFRDLFEAAPIAYIHEDFESRFISANRAARQILGITPEQVPSMVWFSLVPDTVDAQRRVKEAYTALQNGTDTAVILELRRKDNGKPIWVQWWSKPDSDGLYRRTMFIDITEQVLMEQE